MLIEDEPISMDLTRRMDLLDPSLEMVKDGAPSLCLQAAQWRGNPSWMHTLVQILKVPSKKEDLLAMEVDGVPVSAAGANSGSVDNVYNLSLTQLGYTSLFFFLRVKCLASNPLAVQRTQDQWGYWLVLMEELLEVWC